MNLAIDEVRRERKHDPARWSELRQVDAFAEGDALDEVVDAERVLPVRSALGSGPVTSVAEPSRFALMPYVTLAALVSLAFVLRRRNF